jgi:hypothetical protein
MRIIRWTLAAGLVLLGATAFAGAASAQEEAPPPQTPPATELVFDREVFDYPRYNRRNPFSPLVDMADSGPRFEELSLQGIVYSSNPQLSVVLLHGGEIRVAEGVTMPQTFRLRRGEMVGNVRIVEIQPTRVIVDVDEFGVIEQRVFELQRGSGGNSQ